MEHQQLDMSTVFHLEQTSLEQVAEFVLKRLWQAALCQRTSAFLSNVQADVWAPSAGAIKPQSKLLTVVYVGHTVDVVMFTRQAALGPRTTVFLSDVEADVWAPGTVPALAARSARWLVTLGEHGADEWLPGANTSRRLPAQKV